MHKLPLALLVPALFAGCASQEYVDGRATGLETQVAELKARVQTQAESSQHTDGRLAELERRTVEQQRILAQYLERLGGQELALAKLREVSAASQDSLRQLASRADSQDRGLQELRQGVADLTDQGRRQEERIRAADQLATEAAAKAEEALGRGRVMTPAPTGSAGAAPDEAAQEALRVAHEALAQARLAMQAAQSAEERVARLPASAPAPAAQPVTGAQIMAEGAGEGAVARLEATVSDQDGRIAALQGSLEENARIARQAIDLSESALSLGRHNELRLKQSEALYSEVRESLVAQQERLARNEAALQEVSRTAREALERALAAEKLAQGKLLYEVTLTEDDILFPFDQSDLAPGCCDRLQALAERLKAENRGVYLEIQGHTDTSGTTQHNLKLGQERAEAVRRYLHLQAGIPLHRMAAISYGEARPVADNASREGRKKNRRVVIVVLH